jgi:hypothetical protein
MRGIQRHQGGPELADAQEAAPPAGHLGQRSGREDRGIRPAVRRWLAAAAWVGSGLALFVFFLRISLGSLMNSDGANNALQAWDTAPASLISVPGWAG